MEYLIVVLLLLVLALDGLTGLMNRWIQSARQRRLRRTTSEAVNPEQSLYR